MIVTTTGSVEGKRIVEYRGIVSGEAVVENMAVYEDTSGATLAKAKEVALGKMLEGARAVGAGAVVGIDLDYQAITESWLLVTANGTAVVVQ